MISNHAFVDRNKRIGMYVMLTFLEVNGIRIAPTVEDVARVGLAVASGEMKYEELLLWIKVIAANAENKWILTKNAFRDILYRREA